MSDPKLLDEPARLAALKRCELLDTAPEAAFDRITGLVKTVLGVPIATISLIDSDRQWMKSAAGAEPGETPREITFCTHTIKTRQPMVVPDTSLDPRFAANPLVRGAPFIASYLGVPLMTPDGYNIGALCVIDVVPRLFGPEQIEIMKSFAALVTNEIELRRLAQVDHLTGALTRRGFCLEAEKAISRFIRHQQPTAMLLFDIDHFKLVNDQHGHAAGDLVLRAVVASVSPLLRASDVLGRVGGEEFGILLVDARDDDALQAAERFRAAVEAVRVGDAPVLCVTASFGIASVGRNCVSAEDWMARADMALYAAKRGGRNQCRLAPVLALQS